MNPEPRRGDTRRADASKFCSAAKRCLRTVKRLENRYKANLFASRCAVVKRVSALDSHLTTQVARIDLPNNPKGSEVVIFIPGKLRCVCPGRSYLEFCLRLVFR